LNFLFGIAVFFAFSSATVPASVTFEVKKFEAYVH